MSKKVFTVEIKNKRGLHARASAKFAAMVDLHNSEVKVSKDGLTVPGNSIMGLLTLAAEQGTFLTMNISGHDAEKVAFLLKNLVDNLFDEGE